MICGGSAHCIRPQVSPTEPMDVWCTKLVVSDVCFRLTWRLLEVASLLRKQKDKKQSERIYPFKWKRELWAMHCGYVNDVESRDRFPKGHLNPCASGEPPSEGRTKAVCTGVYGPPQSLTFPGGISDPPPLERERLILDGYWGRETVVCCFCPVGLHIHTN